MAIASHGAELWQMHTGLSPNGLAQLIDLVKIPRSMKEIEIKYQFPVGQESVDTHLSRLFARIGSYVASRRLDVVSLNTFVGIDQYYIFGRGEDEYHFRYRSGANRPPQLTVKFQLEEKSNVVRGEINLPVERANPDKIRAFMSVIAALAGDPIMFAIQQSGNIWVIRDPSSGKKVEIVAYRVVRFAPDKLEGVFAEIEPLRLYEDPGEALQVAEKYEKGLGLSGCRCDKSIAELFRPGNEKLLQC